MPRPTKNRRNTDERASLRDSLDFRDLIYEPKLEQLAGYRIPKPALVKVMDQGAEGACTGFGLAAVINYLVRDRDGASAEGVSARMLYEMAKRHDRWPGESYDGSSARGAMKGWFKNGVCLESLWPYEVEDPGMLPPEAATGALDYPCGAFYRVLPRRSDLHAALHEVDVVFATAATHRGWDEASDGVIEFNPRWTAQGGHAFAIIGYTYEGFLIQNSWGEDWGGVSFGSRETFSGCAIWQYADFDRNVWDLWVARLARPLESIEALEYSSARRASRVQGERPTRKGPPRLAIRDHFIHIDDGQFDPQGDYFTHEADVRRMVETAVKSSAKHLVLYGHGGLNSVKDSAARVKQWRPVFEGNRIHEIHFIWETGLFAELRDILLGKQDFAEERAGGISDWFDRWVERVTGPLGRGLWSEMREDAALAFKAPENAGTKVLHILGAALSAVPAAQRPRLHLVGHSAGSILFGRLLERLRAIPELGDLRFENLILFAPACTHDLFKESIKPSLEDQRVSQMVHFLLDDDTERDDTVAKIYRKSLLYLVSRSYQRKGKVVPIMGMQKYLDKLPVDGIKNRIKTFNTADNPDKTSSRSHGGFDNDVATMNSMLRFVLGEDPTRPFKSSDLD